MHTTNSVDIEWWQLFDQKSKCFYYYNIKKKITTWNRPKDFQIFDVNSKINCNELISNIIKSIIAIESANFASEKIIIDDLIKKINNQDYLDLDGDINKNDEKQDKLNILDEEIYILIKQIRYKLIYMNHDIKSNNKLGDNKSSINILPNSNDKTVRQNQPIQPRTNPHYLKVEVTSDYKWKSNSSIISNKKYITPNYNLFNKNEINLSIGNNNSLRTLSRAFLIFFRLLRNTNGKPRFISKVHKSKNIKSKNEVAQNQRNLISSLSSILNFSAHSIKMESVSCNNISPSLCIKDKEKNLLSNNAFSNDKGFLSYELAPKNQMKFNNKLNSIKDNHLNTTESIELNYNKKIQISPSFVFQNSVIENINDTNNLKANLSLNNNCNKVNNINRSDHEKKFFNSISSSSITDIRNICQQRNNQFNQKFQTFRRSLNSKAFSKNTASYSANIKNTNENITRIKSNNIEFNDISKNDAFFSIDSLKNDINFTTDTNSYEDGENSNRSSNFSFFSKKKENGNEMLKWSSQTIQKPLLKTQNKLIKKEACELFKLIQIYMGDRKLMNNFSEYLTPEMKPYFMQNKYNLFSTFNSSNTKTNIQKKEINFRNLTPKDVIALEIIKKGWTYTNLRDELFLQIIKQISSNKNIESFMLGWQLMAICLSFFPPSHKLFSLMTEFILYHSDEQYSLENIFFQINADKVQALNNSTISKKDRKTDILQENEKSNFNINEIQTRFLITTNVCNKRLKKINITGAKKGLKSPLLEEVVLSKYTITTASLFGSSLEEIMAIQMQKFPNLRLPWIQTILSEAVIRLDGAKIEGIFRVPGDLDEVNCLKVRLDQIWCSLETDQCSNSFNLDYIGQINDPNLPASLLKLWYRELYEPLIPNEFYNSCIENCDKPENCIKIVEKLPNINKLVFTYLIKFLKIFALKENVAITKMDASNLSMIMAPNCLRCNSNEAKVIMENTKKEMQFIKTLIDHLDTSIIDNLC